MDRLLDNPAPQGSNWPKRRRRGDPVLRRRAVWGVLAAAVLLWSARAGSAQSESPRRIYVPTEHLDALLTRDRGGVVLPLERFEQLLAEARAAEAAQPRLPRAPVLTRADYTARLEGERLVLTIDVQAHNFTRDWAEVAVTIGHLGVASATVAGEPAVVTRGDPPETLRWLVQGEGLTTLRLEASAPLSVVASDRLVVFPLSGAPAGELRLTLPPGKHLQLGSLTVARPAPAEMAAEYVLPVGGERSLELRITDRAAESRADVLTFASTAYGLAVAPGEVTWTARTSLQVIGRKIDRLVASVPRALEITAVESLGLESWELADAADDPTRTTLTLNWRQSFDGTRSLLLRGVLTNVDPSGWSAPNLRLAEATSHTGVVVVESPAGVRVQNLVAEGARASPAAAPTVREGATTPLPPSASSAASQLRYDLWSEDFTLTFRTELKQRELQAAMTNLLDVAGEGLMLYTLVDVTPRFDRLFELRLTLPAEWEIQELTVAGRATLWTRTPQPGGVNEIQIPLDAPVAPDESRSFRLVARRLLEDWPVEATPLRFALPEVRLPQASVVEALYGVTAEEDLLLAPLDVSGLDPAQGKDLEALRKQLAGTARTLRLGFSYQDTRIAGQIEVARKPTRLSAATLTFLRLDRETVATQLEAQVRIEGGGAKELRVALPAEVGSDLRFEMTTPGRFLVQNSPGVAVALPRLVEQPATVEDGRRIWTLKFDQRLQGDAVIWTEVRQPRGEAREFTQLVLEVLGAERQNGHIAILAAEDQRITLTAQDAAGQPLPLVDPVDFPPSFTLPVESLRSGRQRIVASVQYLAPGFVVRVGEERFDRTAVPTAVCRSAVYETVVGTGGELQHEARLSLAAVGVQALTIRLPEGDRLWGALVDDQPVEVRRAGDVLSLPLPPGETPDKERVVKLFYRGAQESVGALRQMPPRLAVVTGQGGEQPLEVLEQRWVLHHAPDALLLDSRGEFHPERPLRVGTILSRLAARAVLPTRDELIEMGVVAGVVLLVATVLTWLWQRWGKWGAAAGGVGVLLGAAVLVWGAWSLPSGSEFARVAGRAGSMRGDAFQAFPATASPSGEILSMPALEPSNAPPESAASESAGRLGEADRFGVDGLNRAERRKLLSESAEESALRTPALGAAPPPAPTAPRQAPAALPAAADAPGAPPQPQSGIAAGGEAVDGAIPRDAAAEAPAERRDRGALLSLALALAPPENFVERTFRYLGAETDPAAIDLQVEYADRRVWELLIAAIAGGVLLVWWWLRNSSMQVRGWLVVLLIAGPIALSGLVPARWLAICDGLLAGGLLSAIVWCLCGCGRWLVRCCPCCRVQASRTNESNDPAGGQGGTAPAGSLHTAVVILACLSISAGGKASAQEPPSTDPEAGRPVVILPYEVGADPLTADNVLIPREYFLELWRKAHPEEQPPAQPPVAGVVAAAIYQAELDPPGGGERTVRVQARFVIRRLSAEAARLPLPIAPVAIEQAVLDDQPAVLSVSDDGSALEVVATAAGLHVLDVTFRVAASQVTEQSGRFVLPLRPVPSGRLSFLVPGGDETEVRINGAANAYHLREVNGRRVIEAPIDRGGELTISWRPRAARGAEEGSLQVESTIGATVDDAGLTVRHRFRYVVAQGTISEVRLAIPPAARLKRIAGADVAGWEFLEEDGDRIVRVFLRRDVGDSTALDLDLFQGLSLTEAPLVVEVPTLRPVGVTREQGDAAVFADPHLAVQAGDVQGLRQVNVANFTMDPALTQPGATPRLAYRFEGRPFAWLLVLQRRQAESRVVSEHGVQVLLRKLRLASRVQFDLREAPRSTLMFSLPADYLVLQVRGDYLVDWTVSTVDAARVLTVELDQPRTGRVQVLLEGAQPRDPAQAVVSLAAPQPLDIARQESQLGIWLDEAFTATISAAGEWRALDPAQLSEVIRLLRSTAPRFGFRSTQTNPGEIQLALERSRAELSADGVVLVAASDASLDYGLTLRWRIERAAAESFVVTTPAWLGSQIEFTGAGIRQVENLLRPDGSRAWRITLHDPVRGEYLLTAVATLPLPADDLVSMPDLRFLRPDQEPETASELAVQRRFGVVVNLSRVHRLVEVNPEAISPARREQLPLKLPERLLDQALEVVSLPVGGQLPQWRLESIAGTQEAAATVLLADLRTVVAHDGTWRTQADYRVRNRGRQFLAIVPPPESRLLSVTVRDRPSQAIRQEVAGTSLWLVPLPATSAIDLSFGVRVVLAGKLAAPLPRRWSLRAAEIELPAPQVASPQQSSDYGLPVLQTLWRVDLPADVRATLVETGRRSNLTPADVQAAEQIYGRTSLDELKAQLALSYSPEGQGEAAVRLQRHNFEIALQNVHSQTSAGMLSGEGAELVGKAAQRLQELAQQLDQAPPAEASLDRNDFGRKFIVDNNRDILNFNALAIDSGSEADEVVDFSRNAAIVDKLEKGQADLSTQLRGAKSRALVREQLQSQELQLEDAVPQRLAPGDKEGTPSSFSGFFLGRQLSEGEAMGGAPRVEGLQLGQLAAGRWDLAAVGGGGGLGGVGGGGGEWTEAGGLSLPILLPYGERELTFTKVGGDPRLTLAVRTRDTFTLAASVLGGIVLLLLGGGLVRRMARTPPSSRAVAKTLLAAGLAAALVLPSPLRFAGLVLFLAGAVWLVIGRLRRIPAAP
jgi:hypothetical protein